MAHSPDNVEQLIRDNFPPDGAPGLRASFIKHGAALVLEVESRNQRAHQDGEEFDRDRLSIAAGTETRDGKLGNHTKLREAQLRKDREERKSRNAMSIMLADQLALLRDLDNALDYLDRTGDIEGTIKNPAVKAAIKAWEDRTGRKFDPDHPDAKDILKDIIEDYLDEQGMQMVSQLQNHNGLSADENERLIFEARERLKLSKVKTSHDEIEVDIEQIAKDDPEIDALLAQMSEPRQSVSVSPEDELSAFMRAIEETKSLADPMERLQAQKDLLDGLSEDSRMIVSFDPALEDMFKPDYFVALEADQQETQASISAVSPNLAS